MRTVKYFVLEPTLFKFRFQQALKKYGVDKVDIFQTNDLFERRDLATVTNTMFALGRAVRITIIVRLSYVIYNIAFNTD